MPKSTGLLGSVTGWVPSMHDFRAARRRLKSSLLGRPPAKIQAHHFVRAHPEMSVDSDTLGREISSICRFEKLDSPAYRQWLEQLGLNWQPHRKLWELAYICQALDERGLLQEGKRGLGFAVGAEVLPAFFASRGVSVLASDLPAHDSRNRAWAATGQWAAGLAALRHPQICADTLFNQRVQFRPIDMNAIPTDLSNFDFTWSTCSFEHCGSIELGLNFIRQQMQCLTAGGMAIHTTEFNLSSNEKTRKAGNCVIFRLQDLERLILELRNDGHHVEPICLDVGQHPLDQRVDRPPFNPSQHLRLELFGFASTSIGLIIRRRDTR